MTPHQQHKKQIKSLKKVYVKRMDNIQQQVTENADNIVDLRNENAELRKQVLAMQSDINVIQQQKFADTIELAGVIESKDENLKKVVLTLAKAAKIEINANDITNIYRKKNGKIVTKLNSTEKANQMVSGSFNSQLTNTMIGKSERSNTRQQSAKNPNNKETKIYINNALTSLNQLIYKRLRDLKKDKKIVKFAFRNSYF